MTTTQTIYPAAGRTAGTHPRTSRGMYVSGRVHALTTEPMMGQTSNTTECGREIIVHEVYTSDSWTRMPAAYVCKRCSNVTDRTA